MAEPFLEGSTWTCQQPQGWASYGPYGSNVAIRGSGAHIIDADGYDRLYNGASDWTTWPRGAFYQVPPCGGGGGGGSSGAPMLPSGVPLAYAASAAAPAASMGGGCNGCAQRAAAISAVATQVAVDTQGAIAQVVTAAEQAGPLGLPWWIWVLVVLVVLNLLKG